MTRTAVVVLGMHRSGTSAVAGMLAELGQTPPSDPLPSHPDNPKGYFEPLSVVEANEAILAEAGSSWFDLTDVEAALTDTERLGRWVSRAATALRTSFGEAGSFVLKDPRINRLWPVWRDALQSEGIEIVCVLAGRDPVEVAKSLHARDGCALAYGGALWLRHTVAAEAASRGYRRVVLDYGETVSDPLTVSRRLSNLVSASATPEAAAGFVESGLRRQVSPDHAADPLFTALTEVHDAFRNLTQIDDADARAKFDEVAAEAESAFDADELVRREMLVLWEGARLARKKARAWRRRAQKAEATLTDVSSGPGRAADVFAAVPETVVARVRNSGLFDAEWYLTQYADAANAGVDPIRHYLAVGAALGHDPGPLFQTDLYARQMADADENKA